MFRKATDPKVEMMKSISLFSASSDAELSKIAGYFDELELPDGRTIIRQGHTGDECFVIVSGEVAVTTDDREIARLGAGQMVGEQALIDRSARSATVTTTEPTKVLVCTPRGFASLLAGHPSVGSRLLAQLSGRLRNKDAVSA